MNRADLTLGIPDQWVLGYWWQRLAAASRPLIRSCEDRKGAPRMPFWPPRRLRARPQAVGVEAFLCAAHCARHFYRQPSVRRRVGAQPDARGPHSRMSVVSAASREQLVLSADDVRRAIARLSHEIRERDDGRGPLVLVGLRTRGIPLAARLRRHLEEHTGQSMAFGRLDPTLYRDDLRLGRPRVEPTEIPVDVDGCRPRPGGRRVVHGTHRARGAGRDRGPGTARARTACGARRPRASRAADPGRLRG